MFSEKAMATYSSTLAWKIPWMEEPGRLRSMGSLRAETYWGKAKGKSMEGMLQKVTKILATLFIVLAAILNIGKF